MKEVHPGVETSVEAGIFTQPDTRHVSAISKPVAED